MRHRTGTDTSRKTHENYRDRQHQSSHISMKELQRRLKQKAASQNNQRHEAHKRENAPLEPYCPIKTPYSYEISFKYRGERYRLVAAEKETRLESLFAIPPGNTAKHKTEKLVKALMGKITAGDLSGITDVRANDQSSSGPISACFWSRGANNIKGGVRNYPALALEAPSQSMNGSFLKIALDQELLPMLADVPYFETQRIAVTTMTVLMYVLAFGLVCGNASIIGAALVVRSGKTPKQLLNQFKAFVTRASSNDEKTPFSINDSDPQDYGSNNNDDAEQQMLRV
jgi:hypothetical protein